MASWVLKASAKSGNADGASGPFKCPTGAGTVDCTGADLYVVFASGYQNTPPDASDLADVSGNTYLKLTSQSAVGDSLNIISTFYKVGPVVSAVEQWTLTNFGRSQYAGLVAVAFSGCHATPTVGHNESGVTSANPHAGSLGSAGDLVLTGVADYTALVSSIASAFAIIQQSDYTGSNNMGIAAAWQNLIGGIAGAVDPIWTMGASPTAVAVQSISFTPAVGGGSSHAGSLVSGALIKSLIGKGLVN